MSKTLWQQKLSDYMQQLSEAANNLKSIISDYPCKEGEKPDRKRMRRDIREVLGDYDSPELKRLADLLRSLPSFDKRANELSGKEWLQNSISVWNDIRKSREEKRLGLYCHRKFGPPSKTRL